MGRLYYLIGKSSTGKDSILKALLQDASLQLNGVVQYTTRPRRDGEKEGCEYFFITDEEKEALEASGKIIECRGYHTVHGLWQYMFVNDGQLDFRTKSYAAAGTPEAYVKLLRFFGHDTVVPLYIQVETGERLQRALNRERIHDNPRYAEMCRRFLADEEDFSEEELRKAGLLDEEGRIINCFENDELETCVEQIRQFILKREGIGRL